MLLWSHYAKDHSGICIGFKVHSEFNSQCLHLEPRDLNIFRSPIPRGVVPLFKMKYDIKMPAPYNRLIEDEKRLFDFATTKSDVWCYEKEHRIILHNNLLINNPVHFEPTEITDIIFGIKTKDTEKSRIIDITKKYPSSGNWINFYECHRAIGNYKVDLSRI